MNVALRVGLLVVACTFWTALDAVAQDARSAAQTQYRLGARDRIQVTVLELPDFAGETAIGEDGTLNLDVVGTISAAGVTAVELADRIRQRLLDQGLRQATVRVQVLEYRARPVSVVGAVVTPGSHAVPGRSTLLDVLLLAGGPTPESGGKILVRRQSSNGLAAQLEIPTRALLSLADPDLNVPIYPGDIIQVPVAQQIVVHFLGEFEQVGSQTFLETERPTLLTAIARVGGLSDTASKKISIKRLLDSGEREETTVDYKRLLSGSIPDIELRDGDLVVVEESFF